MNYREAYKRPPITDRNWTMPFGKFKGYTIEYLMDAEPMYLKWCIDNEILTLSVSLQDEFEQMNPWLINGQ